MSSTFLTTAHGRAPRSTSTIRAIARWSAALLWAIAAPIWAVPVTWNLQGVIFEDLGTATGSYVFDADTNTFSAISIVTSPNPTLGLGTTYGVATGLGTALFFDTVEGLPPAGNDRLLFDLSTAMTNAGGTIALNLGAGFPDAEGRCTTDACNQLNPGRLIITGSVTSQRNGQVPEPATLVLIALGLGITARQLRRSSNRA